MKIKTRLYLVAALPSIFVLLVGVGLWHSWLKIEQANASENLVQKIKQLIFERNSLSQEFLIYGSPRVETQLHQLHLGMVKILAAMKFDEPEDQRLLQALRQSHDDLDELTPMLLKQGKSEAGNLISGALLVKSQYMQNQAVQLAARQHHHVLETQRSAYWLILVTLIALSALSILLISALNLRIIKGINELEYCINTVKNDKLHRRIQISGQDELGNLVLSLNDMIDRVEAAEFSLRQKSALLEASNKELEAFSYSVSHDLRAPLRSIAGFVELLKKNNYDNIDDKGKHYMEVISSSAIQMGRLIDDILGFSRIGRVEIMPTQVNFDQLLQEVINTLRPQFEGRQIEWKIHSLPEVTGERTMLSLLLLNLVGNALKFSKTRDVSIIEIGQLEGNPHEVVCYVKDNGVGFDMQYSDKLFCIFQRLHPQEEFEGTGVGLANVQRIVQRHGGRVWAEGKVNEGATFYFALPKQGG